MKNFEEAELEIIIFEEDIVVASCHKVTCPANSCSCVDNWH